MADDVVPAPEPSAEFGYQPGRGGVGRRFRVTFLTETVIAAADIRHVIRQVEALGATDIMGHHAPGLTGRFSRSHGMSRDLPFGSTSPATIVIGGVPALAYSQTSVWLPPSRRHCSGVVEDRRGGWGVESRRR